jgi:hypothetical protein
MTAFATAAELSVRLNRTFSAEEEVWVESLLEDAADFMRGVMGNKVYPSAQTTYTAYVSSGWVTLPQSMVRSVDAVTQNGAAITFTQFQDSIKVDVTGAIEVTFTYGVAAAPRDLVAINCALVGQQMLTVEANLGLSAGGLSSVAIDDFKLAFADAGASTGLALTANTEKYLKDNYGSSGWVVQAWR